MFTDEVVGVLDFKSSWRKERDSVSSGTQTRPLKLDEAATQALIREDAEVQTDADERDYRLVEDNSEDLLKFLRDVEPVISKALNRNIQSTAFDGYTSAAELDSGQCNAVHTLDYEEHGGQLSVTSLSWNSTGSVIAASYGRFDHEDWCTHTSSLCTWNVNKTVVSGNKPDTVIDTSSCLMSVDFHPMEPALIAGGTFNGEVMVWDFSREGDMLIAISGKGDDSHSEPISKVLWYPVPGKRRLYHVLSVGLDGKMLIWRLDRDKGSLKLSSGFMLLTNHISRSVKIKSSKKNQEMGVTCLDFSTVDDETFYIGSESGGMFKCSTTSGSQIGTDTHSTPLIDPVTFTFLPHRGPVYSVTTAPYHRNLFLSCSSDTTLRLHSVLQTQPLTIIEPASGYLYTARWSPVRPLVMAVTTQDGHLLVYDLKRSQTSPVQRLDASPGKQAVYTMEFNTKQRQLLATGDALGVVKVWKLNEELTTESAAERDLLNSLSDTSGQE